VTLSALASDRLVWRKRGRIYVPDGGMPWAHHYAFPPTPYLRPDGTLRIYCAFCDESMVGRVGWVDVDPDDPGRVLGVSLEPVLDIGRPGAFDENGVVPTSIVDLGDRIYLYYVGFQLGHKLRYFQFLGLAESTDGGETFTRKQRVPVIDRSDAEMVNRTSGFVRHEDGVFKLWYVGGSDWTDGRDGKSLPVYDMRYLESPDGITWPDEGRTVIALDAPDEHAVGRPWVVRGADGYRMLFSSRTYSRAGYRIGYAESADGLEWTRDDSRVALDVSPEGWDSEMVAYASLFAWGERTYMFYCGNDCGRTGFGWAELER
jgi:predicted GH43/DUF377 family glycosyl hydrolase